MTFALQIVGDSDRMHGIVLTDPAQMARALVPFGGTLLRNGILFLMVNGRRSRHHR